MKKTLTLEPFSCDQGEFLVPPTPFDDELIYYSIHRPLMVAIKESKPWGEREMIRFQGIPLTVENLVSLEKTFKIEISNQTIDK
jgi:hypothetical protein